MSGVPTDTVLRRAAAISFLLLAATLAGCGSGNDDGAKAPAATNADVSSSAAAPVTTTPAKKLTAAQQHAADRKAARLKAIAEKQVAAALPEVTDHPETAKSIKKASPKDERPSRVKSDIDKAKAAIAKAGLTATDAGVAGNAAKAIQVDNTTIAFYPSPRDAAQSASDFASALAANPAYGRIARKSNRIYLLSSAAKLSSQDKADYVKIQAIVDGAL